MPKSAGGLAHIVYFTLHDASANKIEEMLAACEKYLNNHPGVIYFSVGRLNPDLTRPVNVRDFDVALHVIFADKASHDAYQIADRHIQFIAEQKPNWKLVRVFDADLV